MNDPSPEKTKNDGWPAETETPDAFQLMAGLIPGTLPPLPPDNRPIIWTDDEVFGLNAGQHNHNFHPYTCGKDSRHRSLIATRRGWRCADCGYVQGWSHGTGGPNANAEWMTAEDFLGLVRDAFLYEKRPDDMAISIGRWEKSPDNPVPEFVAVLRTTLGQIRRMIDRDYRKGEDLSEPMDPEIT